MANVAGDTTAAVAAAKKVPEVPSGMEAEAALLEAFAQVPNITKLSVRAGDAGRKWLTVGWVGASSGSKGSSGVDGASLWQGA